MQVVLFSNWTQWEIELTGFAAAGADLTKVKEMVIGAGTCDNAATPGGKGTIYIDSIRLQQGCVFAPIDEEPSGL